MSGGEHGRANRTSIHSGVENVKALSLGMAMACDATLHLHHISQPTASSYS